MNQFVPQLMLGNSLTNSSGPPDYKPQWIDNKECEGAKRMGQRAKQQIRTLRVHRDLL